MTKEFFMDASMIYRFLTKGSDELDTLVLCKPSQLRIVTYDQSFYEALGSIEKKSKIDMNRMAKFLEVVDVFSYRDKFGKRNILKEKRVEQIRRKKK